MMDWLRQVRFRLRALFRRRDIEAEMAEEIRSHLEFEAAARRAQGVENTQAQQLAQRAFGGAEQVKEQCRDEVRFLWLEQLGQDVRYACRALAKTPSFTLTAVLTLALGIGVNTALFSVVNMVMLRPLPVKEPENLVTLTGRNAKGGGQGTFSYAEYLDYRDSNRSLEGLIAFTQVKSVFEADGAAQPDPERDARGSGRVTVAMVSDNFFGMLGGKTQLGRGFSPEEVQLGAAPVIVLSNAFWETRFQRNPAVLGRTIMLERVSVTVIGVAGPEFSGTDPVPPAGWMPLSAWSNRPAHYAPGGPEVFNLIGRLKAGIEAAQAKADLDTIAARRAVEFAGERAKVSVQLQRGLRFINLGGKGGQFVSLVVLGFGLVLVIACTNVANLLLARGVARQPEIGIRLTLGAGRGRIVRQLLTENVLLCALGALLGLALATWTLQLLLPVVVGRLPVDWAMETRDLPFFEITPDRSVLGFTALLTLGATLVTGLLPAWHASRANLIATVRSEGTAFGRKLSATRLRKLLVVAQVAVSLTLLSCAGVLVRNLVTRQNAGVGFDAPAIFGASLTPGGNFDRIEDWSVQFRRNLDALRAIPGVAASGLAYPAPLTQGRRGVRIRPAGDTTSASAIAVLASEVSDGFFDTFRVPLKRGRSFSPEELHSTARSVIVSESLARALWPGREAVGQTFEQLTTPGTWREYEVIGVAGDIMVDAFHDERRLVYFPAALDSWTRSAVFVRPREVSAATLTEIVRAAKAAGIELQFERRYSFWVEFALLPSYAFAVVSATLGALALGMASVGLYGLMTFTIHRRVHEIGVRMALGATARQVVELFVRQGMWLVAIGGVVGLIGGALFTLTLSRLVDGFVDGFDPVAFGAVALLFGGIAWLACWLPARRATRVDPMVALRAE